MVILTDYCVRLIMYYLLARARVSAACARTSPNGRGIYTWRARRCAILWNDRGRTLE